MAIDLGLTGAEMRAFRRTLIEHHRRHTDIRVLTLDGEPLYDLTGVVRQHRMAVDGQVNVSRSGKATRAMALSIVDPERALGFDSDSPARGALFLDRMLQATVVVSSPRLRALGVPRVRVPIFTGPIVMMSRQAEVVSVEAAGKEMLAQSSPWDGLTIRAGTPKVTAIRRLLSAAGEKPRNIDLPEAPKLGVRGAAAGGEDDAPWLPNDLVLTRDDTYWAAAVSIARSLDRQLFYDGAGRVRLRRWPSNPVHTLELEGALTEPELTYSLGSTVNAVTVVGKGWRPRSPDADDDVQGAAQPDARVEFSAVAPRAHPLSPWRIGREDAPRYITRTIRNPKLRSDEECREVAIETLDRTLRQSVSLKAEVMPLWHLDLGDVMAYRSPDNELTTTMNEFSLPVSVGDGGEGTGMAVGFRRQVSRPMRRHRR